MLGLQESVNAELLELFEINKHLGRDVVSDLLVNAFERLVINLNHSGQSFGCADDSPDINYEDSEQTFSDGQNIGHGVVLLFPGVSVKAIWNGE